MKLWAYASAGVVATVAGVTAVSLTSSPPAPVNEPPTRSIAPPDPVRPASANAPCTVEDLRAWVNRQPGQPISIIVTGRVRFDNGAGGPVTVAASLDEDAGMLSLSLSGSGDGAADPVGFRYEEAARVRYTAVRIMCNGQEAARQTGVPRVT